MKLQLTIEFKTPAHHGSGFGLAGVVDRAVLRSGDGTPYLAGSAIKGKFRFAMLQLLEARREPWCGPPKARWCREAPWCSLCGIFGSPMNPGSAVFEDAFPEETARRVLYAQMEGHASSFHAGGTNIRASTAIDRKRRTVRPQHLFTTETVSAVVRFEGAIDGIQNGAHTRLLGECCKLLTTFGAGGARGLGFCRYEITPAAPPVEKEP